MCPFVDSDDLEQFVTEIVGRRLREQLANNVLRTDVPPRSLPLSKLSGAGATAGDAALFDGSVWAPGGVATQVELDAHVNDTTGAHQASAIDVTESGIIIPGAMSVQQAMRAIEFQAEQLRQRIGSHHHDERYVEHPPLGTPDGCTITSDTSSTGGASWSTRQTSHYASMYVANSGAPTNTGSGGWQKVGSGGGTATYTSEYDIRPNGVGAQVDTTNKYLLIRQAGVYLVSASIGFSAITAAKFVGVGVWKAGAQAAQQFQNTGQTNANVISITVPIVCAANDTLELYAITDDSASEAYLTGSSFNNRITATYLGPAT